LKEGGRHKQSHSHVYAWSIRKKKSR